MPRKDIDYSRCIIYKIVCNDFNVKDLYVGHTTDLVKRRWQHKTRCTNSRTKGYDIKIYKVIRDNGGWDNWSIIVVENFSACKNAEDARTRERYWFEHLNASLNTILPIITKQEIYDNNKQYYENNKESVLQYQKQYRADNKDKSEQYSKQYYIEH